MTLKLRSDECWSLVNPMPILTFSELTEGLQSDSRPRAALWNSVQYHHKSSYLHPQADLSHGDVLRASYSNMNVIETANSIDVSSKV